MASLHDPSLFQQKTIFVVGPTAVGKSAVAIELARALKGEIVSCDAMQVYREIAIASDKPAEAVQRDIRHHLVDVVSVEEEFNVARYRALACGAIAAVHGRGHPAVVCGGSGMYMMVILDGIFESEECLPEIKEALAREAVRDLKGLYERLKAADPVAASRIKPADARRIIRALEVFEATGKPISELQSQRDGLWGKGDIRVFGLERPREELYARAEARIEAMFAQGLVDEVTAVLEKKITSSVSRLIGIPEVEGFIRGAYDISRAKYLMKLNTRHYIKRQMTWFRRDKRVEWVCINQGESPVDTARTIMEML